MPSLDHVDFNSMAVAFVAQNDGHGDQAGVMTCHFVKFAFDMRFNCFSDFYVMARKVNLHRFFPFFLLNISIGGKPRKLQLRC